MMTLTREMEEKIEQEIDAELRGGTSAVWQAVRVVLERAIREIQATLEKMQLAGRIEETIGAAMRKVTLEAIRVALQAKCDGTPPECPRCKVGLRQVEWVERTILASEGGVTLKRAYGLCPKCGERSAPADVALGLEPRETSSPARAEKMTWLSTYLPPVEAAEVLERMTGASTPVSRVQRVVERKGEEALEKRKADMEKALSAEGRVAFSKENRDPDEPPDFEQVIVIDGMQVRERDDWGGTKEILEKGGRPERWHELKTARFFRLDQRVRGDARSLLLGSHSICTRMDAEEFGRLVLVEAIRKGMLRAGRVIVIADGAVWIWKIVRDRFSHADTTLDFYHASQHLWAVANARFGEGTDEAKAWVAPLLHKLRNGEHKEVVVALEELATANLDHPLGSLFDRESRYFRTHERSIDYKGKSERGEPAGSGSVESLNKQYQIRVKRSGQFWGTDGLEGVLQLVNLRRNGLWDSIWPHLQSEN